MTKKEISLQFIWNIRLKLRAEANKLRAEANKLVADGSKRYAEANKRYAEGDWLCAEARKLWEGAIIEAYGNITIKWKYDPKKDDCECHLETGEVFKP